MIWFTYKGEFTAKGTGFLCHPKSKTQVIIAGKIYTLSGYESEEYLQKVAAYLNGKITEFRGMDGYHRLSQEMRSILLNLNIADDYFKVRKKDRRAGRRTVGERKRII